MYTFIMIQRIRRTLVYREERGGGGGNRHCSTISDFSRKQRKRDGREERIELVNKGKAKGRYMSPDGASDEEEEKRESWNPIEYDPWLYCRYFPRAHPSPIVLGREAAE